MAEDEVMPEPMTPIYELLDPEPGSAVVLVVDSDALIRPHLCGLLSKQERAQCHRYHHPSDRVQSAVMRGLLRLGAGVLTGKHPRDVVLQRDRMGRPKIVGVDDRDRMDLNATRSGACCALVLARGARCGVDIERVEPAVVSEELVRFLTQDEKELMRLSRDPAAFFWRWVQTEAVLKGDGRGLAEGAQIARPRRSDALGAWEAERASLWALGEKTWRCMPISTPPGVVGACAFDREGVVLSHAPCDEVDRRWICAFSARTP